MGTEPTSIPATGSGSGPVLPASSGTSNAIHCVHFRQASGRMGTEPNDEASGRLRFVRHCAIDMRADNALQSNRLIIIGARSNLTIQLLHHANQHYTFARPHVATPYRCQSLPRGSGCIKCETSKAAPAKLAEPRELAIFKQLFNHTPGYFFVGEQSDGYLK